MRGQDADSTRERLERAAEAVREGEERLRRRAGGVDEAQTDDEGGTGSTPGA